MDGLSLAGFVFFSSSTWALCSSGSSVGCWSNLLLVRIAFCFLRISSQSAAPNMYFGCELYKLTSYVRNSDEFYSLFDEPI
jgi:hypothetical protein